MKDGLHKYLYGIKMDENANMNTTNTNVDSDSQSDNICTVNTQDNKNTDTVDVPRYEYDSIIISGGALHGILPLGAISYCIDRHMLDGIKTYVGVSSGAITCYLLSLGYSAIDMLVYIIQNNITEKMSKLNVYSMIDGNGALSFSVLQEHLEKMTIEKIGYFPTLKNMKDKYGVTLVFVTYNMTRKIKEYLSWETYPDLMCITALRMSAGFPFVFEKFKYGDSYYIDGGLCDNFPIEIAIKSKLHALCFLLKQNDEGPDVRSFNMIEYLYELIKVPINTILDMKEYTLLSNDIKIIKLVSGSFNILSVGMNSIIKLDMFSSGYQQCKEQLESLSGEVVEVNIGTVHTPLGN